MSGQGPRCDLRWRRYRDGLLLLDPESWETHFFGPEITQIIDDIRCRLGNRQGPPLTEGELETLLDDEGSGVSPRRDDSLTDRDFALLRKLVRVARLMSEVELPNCRAVQDEIG